MKIEIFRICIPAAKLMNENSGQNHRIQQGKEKFIQNHVLSMIDGTELFIGNFKLPELDKIQELLKVITPGLIVEMWRPGKKRFDPVNYTRTMKYPIDILTKIGYLIDDDWKHTNYSMQYGGGPEVWKKRAFRYDGDNLPEELSWSWWQENCGEINDMFFRIILDFGDI